MKQCPPEFDQFSREYDDLLKDPIRDRFVAGNSRFFHERKRDLIRDYFLQRHLDTNKLRYLDLGCGGGELITLLRDDFGEVAGCDPSPGMIENGLLPSMGITARVQESPEQIPFENGLFDFVTAVCVYHHVTPGARAPLTKEVSRVLKPGGVFAIIEHNPYNPITQLIVSRTPIDADALLLRPSESRSLLGSQGFTIDAQRFFLYLPEALYRRIGRVEQALSTVPLGGQYAVFGRVDTRPERGLA